MSKKVLLALVLSLVVVLSFGAAAKLIDGTYSMKGETDDHGYYPSISIEVKDGKLAKVDYKEIVAESGDPKSTDNYPYAAYFTAVETLNAKAVEVNGDIAKIDAVAGASHSSATFEDMLLAVQIKAAKLVDGAYPPVTAGPDDHGYTAQLSIVAKDGKIAKAEYLEFNAETKAPKAKGVYPYDLYFDAAEYFSNVVVKENGNIMNIDSVAGATQSSDKFFALYRAYLNTILSIAKK